MNIRLSSDEVRFRISEEEHQTLLKTRCLSDSLRLPEGVELRYCIAVTDSQERSDKEDRLSIALKENNLTLTVTDQAVAELGDASSIKEGIAEQIPIDRERSLKCFLQIDMGRR